MSEAIWSVIGDDVVAVAAVLVVLHILVAVEIGLLDGLRVDRWGIKRLEGAFARMFGKK